MIFNFDKLLKFPLRRSLYQASQAFLMQGETQQFPPNFTILLVQGEISPFSPNCTSLPCVKGGGSPLGETEGLFFRFIISSNRQHCLHAPLPLCGSSQNAPAQGRALLDLAFLQLMKGLYITELFFNKENGKWSDALK